jgi:hypothetical protein
MPGRHAGVMRLVEALRAGGKRSSLHALSPPSDARGVTLAGGIGRAVPRRHGLPLSDANPLTSSRKEGDKRSIA